MNASTWRGLSERSAVFRGAQHAIGAHPVLETAAAKRIGRLDKQGGSAAAPHHLPLRAKTDRRWQADDKT
ncbi:MAG TPA: hypothetical protein VHE13_08575 [Opitutus sp.]|nr:hypothetical protein [Opitutus sp.]